MLVSVLLSLSLPGPEGRKWRSLRAVEVKPDAVICLVSCRIRLHGTALEAALRPQIPGALMAECGACSVQTIGGVSL